MTSYTAPYEPSPRPAYLALPHHRPIATWVLLALIVLVFAAETIAGGSTRTDVLVRLGAKVSPLIASGEFWRLLTSMFLHVGVMHLLFNSYALVIIGTELEGILGAGRFLAVYLLSGLFGSLASYAFSPNISAGASGAIFGLIGALGVFFLQYRQQLGQWGRARLGNIAFLIVLNLILGFTNPNIDNLAHIGGLIAGAALGWAVMPRYEPDAFGERLVDRNGLRRYWPALLLAVIALVGGTALATRALSDSPSLHLFRGEEAVEQGAWDEAAAELEQAVAGDPTQADAFFYLGLARNHLEQPELAAAAYESALALEPDSSPVHWNLALTYLELRRDADARAQFEAYLELNPDEAARVQPYLDQLPAP